MKMIKIIDRKLNIVELPCGKWCNSLDLDKLDQKKLINEMGRTYQVLTKWIFSISLPLFLIFFVFPDTVLKFLYGANYIED